MASGARLESLILNREVTDAQTQSTFHWTKVDNIGSTGHLPSSELEMLRAAHRHPHLNSTKLSFIGWSTLPYHPE